MRQALLSLWVMGMAAPLVVAATAAARAQETQPNEQPAMEQASPSGPGLIDELGKLLKKPVDMLPSLSKSEPPPPAVVQDALPAAPPPVVAPPAPAVAQAPPLPAQVAAPPADPPPSPSAAEPPSTRFFPGMASGREICPSSANGAPDCQAATDNLCKSKGYKGGKSLSIDSAYGCSARQARDDRRKACGTQHYVTSAFCT